MATIFSRQRLLSAVQEEFRPVLDLGKGGDFKTCREWVAEENLMNHTLHSRRSGNSSEVYVLFDGVDERRTYKVKRLRVPWHVENLQQTKACLVEDVRREIKVFQTVSGRTGFPSLFDIHLLYGELQGLFRPREPAYNEQFVWDGFGQEWETRYFVVIEQQYAGPDVAEVLRDCQPGQGAFIASMVLLRLIQLLRSAEGRLQFLYNNLTLRSVCFDMFLFFRTHGQLGVSMVGYSKARVRCNKHTIEFKSIGFCPIYHPFEQAYTRSRDALQGISLENWLDPRVNTLNGWWIGMLGHRVDQDHVCQIKRGAVRDWLSNEHFADSDSPVQAREVAAFNLARKASGIVMYATELYDKNSPKSASAIYDELIDRGLIDWD